MNAIIVNDLGLNTELDRQALKAIRGSGPFRAQTGNAIKRLMKKRNQSVEKVIKLIGARQAAWINLQNGMH